MEAKEPELIMVRITRKEFLRLPLKTRQRIVKEQVDELIRRGNSEGVANSCEAMCLE